MQDLIFSNANLSYAIQEFYTSLWWVFTRVIYSIIAVFVVGAILYRMTKWMPKIWRLARSYWTGRNALRPIGAAIAILVLNVIDVRIALLFNQWFRAFYNSLEKYEEKLYVVFLFVFLFLAIIYISLVLIEYLLKQLLALNWRLNMNTRLVNQWMSQDRFYRTQFLSDKIDNPDQRIQIDIASFTTSSLNIFFGTISSVLSMVSFTIVLWDLSVDLTILGYKLERGLVFICFTYVIVATVISYLISRPLIILEFLSERYGADYRYSLIRIREYAESIAFYRGSKNELKRLNSRFQKIYDNYLSLVYNWIRLNAWNLAVSQAALVLPYMLVGAGFFQGLYDFGSLMQIRVAFGRVQSSLSYFRNMMSTYADYMAVVNRLDSFVTSLAYVDLMPKTIVNNRGKVAFHNVTVFTPNAKVLLKDVDFTLGEGGSLLIRGPSGCGKTSLLRSIAGLWPFIEGSFDSPDEAVFLSQKIYLPEGTLLDSLYYPLPAPSHSNDAAKAVLQQVSLGYLADKLEQHDNWQAVLSGGEQQRLAFARIFLIKPKVVFLDEATASMDPGLELFMYQRLREVLPHAIIISVSHRESLILQHQFIFDIQDGKWGIFVRDQDYFNQRYADLIAHTQLGTSLEARQSNRHLGVKLAGSDLTEGGLS